MGKSWDILSVLKSRGLASSALLTFLTQLPTQFFAIAAGVFITRILGPEGRGAYAIFMADVGLLTTILSFSISTAIIHFIAEGSLDAQRIWSISLLFSLVTSIASGIIVFAIWASPLQANFFPVPYTGLVYTLWLFLFLLLTLINSVFTSFLQGARRFDRVNQVLLVNSLVNVCGYGVMFYLWNSRGVQVELYEILLLALLVMLFNTGQWLFHFRKVFKVQVQLGPHLFEDLRKFTRFAGLGHLSNVISFLNYRFVIWALAFYLDNASVGIFSVAVGVSQLLYFISNPLSQVLLPYLSAAGQSDRRKIFTRFARAHFSIVLLLALVSMIFASWVIPVIYGEEFVEAGGLYSILVLGIVLSCQTRIIANYFISNSKLEHNLIATVGGIITAVLLNIILIPRFGMNGAAYAQCITYLVVFAIVLFFFLREGKGRLGELFLIKREDWIYARTRFQGKQG